MKKFLALFLALTLVLGLCACGGGEGAGSGDEGLTADGKVKLKIGLPVNAYIMDYENNEMTKWIEEKCGVEIEFVQYAGGTDVATQISTAVNAGKPLPDIIYAVKLDDVSIKKYGTAEPPYFVDLAQYMYKDGEPDLEGPAKVFWERINNELNDVERNTVLSVMRDPETGGVYGMPMIETSLIDKLNYMLWINTNWLKEAGMEKPTNNQELLDVLRAFQDLGMPLYGSEKVISSRVITWLINLFTYYNRQRPFTVSEDGKTLTHTATTEAYRDALKYCYDLYAEEILNDMAWTASGSGMAAVLTPQSGEAMVGLAVAHLTVAAAQDNMVLAEYEPLANWGYAVREDISCYLSTFITTDCQNPDKAFEVLMTLFSKEGSVFVRYGAEGINWEKPDEGAKSDVGLDAEYKIIADPLKMQNTSNWGKMGSTLVYMAEGELAQMAEGASEWLKLKAKLHGEASRLFEEAEKNNNPEYVCPVLRLTAAEEEQYDITITNVETFISRAQTEFIKGERDPYNDADWNAYLKEANDLGLEDYMKVHQMAYDRGN